MPSTEPDSPSAPPQVADPAAARRRRHRPARRCSPSLVGTSRGRSSGTSGGARRQGGHRASTRAPRGSIDDVSVKADMIAGLATPPQLVILGGSRGLRIEPAYLKQKTGLETFHAGVPNERSEEAWALTPLRPRPVPGRAAALPVADPRQVPARLAARHSQPRPRPAAQPLLRRRLPRRAAGGAAAQVQGRRPHAAAHRPGALRPRRPHDQGARLGPGARRPAHRPVHAALDQEVRPRQPDHRRRRARVLRKDARLHERARRGAGPRADAAPPASLSGGRRPGLARGAPGAHDLLRLRSRAATTSRSST